MRTSSREDSPDWLRSFQAPAQSAIDLSSDSEAHLTDDDEDDINLSKLFGKEITESSEKIEDDQDGRNSQVSTSKAKSPSKIQKSEQTIATKRKREDLLVKEGKKAKGRTTQIEALEKPMTPHEPNHSVWTLSDSDSCPESILDKNLPTSGAACFVEMGNKEGAVLNNHGESPTNGASNVKTTKKKLERDDDKPAKVEKENMQNNGRHTVDVDIEEELPEKCSTPYVSSSGLPLVLSEKVQRSKALVECEGDSIDLSGDVGAVGRVVISDESSGNHEMLLDLKGTIYRTSIIPSRTYCIVNFGQSEAKVEAIMNDFISLNPQSNVDEAETMVEGTLEGFSFDSENEIDDLPKGTLQNNQDEDAEEKAKGKTKKKADKASGVSRNKVKTTGAKQPKKVKRKSQAPKKGKTKK